jgi:hypothetical protein
MTKTEQRLQELLDAKDREIEALSERIEELENVADEDWTWCKRRVIEEPQTLPVPRLEIRCIQLDEWHRFRWEYALIYRHTTGEIICSPMGETSVNGGSNRPPVHNGEIQLPFRDGVHIGNDSIHLNIAAFAIVGSTVQRFYGVNEHGRHIWGTP